MADFRPAKRRLKVSVGESVRIVRELQGLSQNQLAERTGIPQGTLSAIENDRQPECNIYEARTTIEMICGVFESHRVGGPVKLPLKTRENPLLLL